MRHLSVLLLSIFVIQASALAAQPNVVFILADDLGWADTTLYGHTQFYHTPNLERLAKRGMTFTHAYSASPLCSPTRSAALTGLSPARTGITTPNCHLPQVVLAATLGAKGAPDQKSIQPNPVTRLKTDYPTLAKTLKAAGYATAHFGKWHLGPEPYSPLQQGFDVDLPHWAGPGPAGSYVAPWKFKDFDADPGEPDQHIEDRMAKEAVAFMEKHKDGPFYLNYWMFSVHAPFDAKKALIEKYRATVDASDPQRSPTYAAMIESMDDAVGTLMDTLDRLGIADNTILIFTSDNGGNMYNEVDGTTPTSNAPLRGGKASMFEGGTRVPCVIAWPGLTTPGARSDAIVQSEDYFPTLLEGLGLKPMEGQIFDGASLIPAFKGDPLTGKAVFQFFPHNPGVPDWLPPAVSVHRDDWKLIRIFHGGEKGAHRYLLYDLHTDLGEKNNLAAQKPELVAELDAMIAKFLVDTHAVVPIPNPGFNPALYHPEREGIQTNKTKSKSKAKAATQGGAKDESDPTLQGWKIRNGTAKVTHGIVSVRGADAPFLGVGAGLSGPAKVTFRIRAKAGAKGKVEWLATDAKAQSLPYAVPGDDWQTLSLEIPATGPLGIFRIYLPAQQHAVEIDFVELTGGGKPRRWDF
ncbi:MAG: sulfatase [Verrucomicrobiales bacterium]|nr:sulfatase [Verrucomicrobiales bacterium]MCP5557245.1 sulfatase [Verrucomicrobiaceae bacterium]